jgi:glutaredoxin-related protein
VRASKISQMVAFSGGSTTVPQIFFNSVHIGGYDDLVKLEREGKLAEIVRAVKNAAPTMMQDHWYHPWY